MPPVMPRRGLKVFWASASPAGTEMTTDNPPGNSHRRMIARTFSSIMRRGTELMAAAPTGWSSPRFVTRPTPAPPSIVTPGASVFCTRAKISVSRVTSGSSPLSLRIAQETKSAPRAVCKTGSVRAMPLGVSRSTVGASRPVSSI